MSGGKRRRPFAPSTLIRPSCRVLLLLLLTQCLWCQARSRPKPRSLAVASRAPESPAATTVEPSEPCRRTSLCVQFGRCSYRAVDATDAAYRWIPVARTSPSIAELHFSCVASTDADCERSTIACPEQGDCAARGGVCVAADDAHCAASQWCKLGDLCSAVDGWCQRGEKSPCAGSAACRARGLCSGRPMSLARIEDIFFASRESLVSDPDRSTEDMWAPPEPLVDPRSFVVANQVASVQGCVARRSQDCRASEVCRERGLCVAREGECRQARTSTEP